MEQMTTIRDLVGQVMQKKEEEKRIAEDQAAKDRYWKIPICYDDDEDYTIAITPVLPIKEPDNSLSMGDEHLDTVPATESDEVIKSSVEDLVPIPSESEGIPDKMYDVPLYENTTPFDYVEAHLPMQRRQAVEVWRLLSRKLKGFDDDIHLTNKDDILHIEPDPGDLASIDPGIHENVSTTNVNVPLEDDQSSLFAYVVWIFLVFLTYPVVPPYHLSTGNEDPIFDPDISIYHSFMPDVSHRSETFMKFNVYPNRLNENPMTILSSTCFPIDQ
ncbi:hypothetical protein Tco_0685056 [Tanacetum coccineum]